MSDLIDRNRNLDPVTSLLFSVYDQVLAEYRTAKASGISEPTVLVFDLDDIYSLSVAQAFLGEHAIAKHLKDVAGAELAVKIVAIEDDDARRLPGIDIMFIGRRRHMDDHFLVNVITGGISALVALDVPLVAPPDAGLKRANPLLN